MKKIQSYSIESPVKGICKSPAIWVHYEGGASSPVCYFLKPKWMTDEQFKKIIEGMKYIHLPGEL